jgi:hypothetical protein
MRTRKHKAIDAKPPAEDWTWLDALAGKLDKEVAEAANEPVKQQRRPELDRFFAKTTGKPRSAAGL